MPALKNDKFREYTRYAEYCLNMVASTRDQELCAQREMAALLCRGTGRIQPPPVDARPAPRDAGLFFARSPKARRI